LIIYIIIKLKKYSIIILSIFLLSPLLTSPPSPQIKITQKIKVGGKGYLRIDKICGYFGSELVYLECGMMVNFGIIFVSINITY
jgi:hypothetical protein